MPKPGDSSNCPVDYYASPTYADASSKALVNAPSSSNRSIASNAKCSPLTQEHAFADIHMVEDEPPFQTTNRKSNLNSSSPELSCVFRTPNLPPEIGQINSSVYDLSQWERVLENNEGACPPAILASSETLSSSSHSLHSPYVASGPSFRALSSPCPLSECVAAPLCSARSFNVHSHSEPCASTFSSPPTPDSCHPTNPLKLEIPSRKSAQVDYASALSAEGVELTSPCKIPSFKSEKIPSKRASFPPSSANPSKGCGNFNYSLQGRRASTDGVPVHSYQVSLNAQEMELHVHFRVHEPCDDDTSEDEGRSKEQEKPMLPSAESLPGPSSKSDNRKSKRKWSFSSGIGQPSVYHALVVIFLEFFAWGLLTNPMIEVLKETFPDYTFLMNGIIMGMKGLLSFLSAPLIGALSDVWGRKFFLFVTVFFTCLPIPFMKIDTWWYFALISISGVFAVTYSIVFAYVADVTDVADRHHAYGLVSATFAASLVVSPALGAYLGKIHSNDLVVGLATAIAVLDIFFILVAVPESLPEKLRVTSTWSSTQISWEQADPFTALVKVSKDRNILLVSVTVFLSYLPEAGQLSCFFVYLKLVMDFGPELVATFIAMVGILSVIAQTALLGLLIRTFSNKKVITIGLLFEFLQLMWYGFGSQQWMMWAAGVLAAISSITYPAISAYVSTHADVDKQGVVQGIVTGMRGLCAGLGPAVFGLIFYLFHVDLNEDSSSSNSNLPAVAGGGASANISNITGQGDHIQSISQQIPGPPFVFGAILVLLALTVSAFIPEESGPKKWKQAASDLDIGYSRDHKKNDSLDGTSQPLMNETGVL